MKAPLFSSLIASAALVITSSAQAQAVALPAPVYTTSASALSVARTVWGAASLIVNPGVGAAVVSTISGGTLGLTPVAGIAAGVAVLGVSFYYTVKGPDGIQRDILMLIGSNASLLNPDYGATTYTTVKGPWTWPSYPFINTTNDPATDSAFKKMIVDQLIYSGAWVFVDPSSFELPSTTTSSTSTRIYFRYFGQPVGTSAGAWYGSYIDKTVNARTCPAGYTYSVETTGCIMLNDTISDDSTCRVSYDASGAPVYNIKDPDCNLAKSSGGFSVQPPTPTSPAVVNITDSTTNRVLRTELYTDANQGYAPGTFKTTERVPDYNNSVVRESSTLMSAPAAGTNSPTVQQSTQKTYDGVNTNIGQNSTTLDKVTIGNWPTSLDGLGSSMSQVANNTARAADASQSMLSELRTISTKLDKTAPVIDTQIPAESSSLPSAPADLAASDHKTFLDPLKEKLAGFAEFEFPAHTSSCPAFAFNFNVWGVSYDVSSNYMCQWLEDNRGLLSGLMYVSYLIAAIVIFLGA